MRLAPALPLLLLHASACTDSTPLADLRDASVGVALWDCSEPNVPLGCDHAFVARIGIGGDGLGSSDSPPCVTLDSDLRATINGESFSTGALGGEFEGDCESAFFLAEWDAPPPDLATDHIVIADASAMFALDAGHLFADRRIDILSPTGDVHPGDHVEAQLVAAPGEVVETGSTFVCAGDCPSYLQFTLADGRFSFDVPATTTDRIKLGLDVTIAITGCDGPARCLASANVSRVIPVVVP
jgi:hypothetical protein